MSLRLDVDFPEEAFRAWAGTTLAGNGPFEVDRVPGGNSNVTLLLSREGHRWVLRCPPPGATTSTHDLIRETNILVALRDSDIPHARLVGVCEEPDVIGSPFAVLEWVEGICPYASLPAAATAADAAQLAAHVVEVLCRVHALPPTGSLATMGRASDFCARQPRRWLSQLDKCRTRELPDLDCALALLGQQVPAEHAGVLIHGDYGLHNLMTTAHPPLRVVAVLDWETATIGHPFLDLGHLLLFWPGSTDPTPWRRGLPEVPRGLFPPRQYVLERYVRCSGSDDVESIGWFAALAAVRMAVILEGTYKRVRNRPSEDPFIVGLAQTVPYLAQLGLELIEGGWDRMGLS